jgi:hypothetical protein
MGGFIFMKKCFLAVLLAVLAAMFQAGASFGCDCGVLGGMLNSLGERVVNGISLPLDATIREAAGYNVINLRQDLTALRETVMLTRDSVVSAIEALDRNAAERVTERTYEMNSQPRTICGNDLLGASWQLGARNREQAGRDILERVLERPGRYSRPVDFIRELGSGDWPGALDTLSLDLGGGARTYSLSETSRAEMIIESLTNPLPAPGLLEEKKESPAGRNYEALKRDYELRLSIYQGVLSRSVADRAPTVDGLEDWVRGKWNDMGGSGDPPGLVEGKISQETLFWFLTNMRLASANWHEEAIATLPEAGLLREMVAMQAVGLELLRQQNERLRDLTLLISLDGLESLNGKRRAALLAQYSLAERGAAN